MKIIGIYKILQSIWNHPFNAKYRMGGILRFFHWQIFTFFYSWQVLLPITGKVKMVCQKGMTAVTGCFYSGILEFNDVLFVLHSLRKDDLFVDVGSNVGVYSILASGEVGARSIAIEPISYNYEILTQNVRLNKLNSKIETFNIGASDCDGVLSFNNAGGTICSVESDIEVHSNNLEMVKVSTLDSLLKDRSPLILKIDVEGYEYAVLKGALKSIEKLSLKAILIELTGLGSRYGFDEIAIHNHLLSMGFRNYKYDAWNHKFSEVEFLGNHNSLYLREIEFFKSRVSSAPKIQIKNKYV